MACLRKRSVGSSGALATRLGESANSSIQRGPVEVQIRRLQMRRGRQQHHRDMFTNHLFSILQEDSSVSMDDVAASGSVALEEDKAGCLFCIGYVRWHGRDRPPKALWKASALWWLGRSGRASMGAEDIDGIDAQYGCCRQGGCDALNRKRSLPKRQAPVAQHAESAAKQWQTALESRKRAFKDVGSKEVTAYKKRRKADRNRVEKKFFVDHDLPKPQAEDIAPNDAGLPRVATSSQAAFVGQWCKFGSWAICKQCHSLQPRPLEPVDTRRVAGAEMTAKACKQCRGKHWVPQPEDIPHPLRKLSLKLAKVLRPLDLDIGPVKKANNGYRIHSSMTRLSWSKVAVLDKIRK
eukprot:symbB.v1.2.022173.t1/scaffold1915.1/size133927/1